MFYFLTNKIAIMHVQILKNFPELKSNSKGSIQICQNAHIFL